uniref:NADH dehydrogenase subunit 4L n=1 Tax=Odontobutis obscura TaxID=86244 RepID=A0A0S1RQL5_9GOBI|nr:NADH dehydrogenase subunit 4L [Odontobutis obscura]
MTPTHFSFWCSLFTSPNSPYISPNPPVIRTSLLKGYNTLPLPCSILMNPWSKLHQLSSLPHMPSRILCLRGYHGAWPYWWQQPGPTEQTTYNTSTSYNVKNYCTNNYTYANHHNSTLKMTMAHNPIPWPVNLYPKLYSTENPLSNLL